MTCGTHFAAWTYGLVLLTIPLPGCLHWPFFWMSEVSMFLDSLTDIWALFSLILCISLEFTLVYVSHLLQLPVCVQAIFWSVGLLCIRPCSSLFLCCYALVGCLRKVDPPLCILCLIPGTAGLRPGARWHRAGRCVSSHTNRWFGSAVLAYDLRHV